MERYLRDSNRAVSDRIGDLRRQMERQFGGLSRIIDYTVGPFLLWAARHDAAAYPTGRPLEPQTFCDRRNW